MQKKNGKERAAGEEKIELHLYYVIGRAGGRSWRTSAGRRRLEGWSAVLHLYYVIGRAGRRGGGHQLAVVAYRSGQLYCICTQS